MSYSRYDTASPYEDRNRGSYRDAEWERRLRRTMRSREGFAWGAFLIGFVLGGIIF